MTETWTVKKILDWTVSHFQTQRIESARLDAELLLAHALRCQRLDLYLRFDQPVSKNEQVSLRGLIQRRLKYEPVSYILGQQEFYSRRFEVGPGVLVPRPETESLVDESLKYLKPEMDVLDIGCGSGCIGITLALEVDGCRVTLLEKNQMAIGFAQKNAEVLGVEKQVRLVCDSLENFRAPEKFSMIVSNPPYVAEEARATLMKDVVDYEPSEALFGGHKGVETILRWIPYWIPLLTEHGILIFEMGVTQASEYVSALKNSGGFSDIEVINDYTQRPRFIKAIRNNIEGTNNG